MKKKCDLCGEAASVMIEEIIDGKRKKIFLCAKCYFEKFISKKIDEEIDKMMKSGEKSGASFIKIVPENLVPVDDDDDFDVPADDDFDDDSDENSDENDVPADDENDVPADDSRDENLFEEDDFPFEIEDENPEKVCDFCGTKFSDFLKNRRVGCAHCYKKFAKAIERDLLVIHSANRHLALIGGENRRKKLPSADDLQTLYQRAIAEENYEEAIRLRDLMGVPAKKKSEHSENSEHSEKKRVPAKKKFVPASGAKSRSRGRPRKKSPKKGDENGK